MAFGFVSAPQTYQDVKRTLHWFTVVLLLIVGLLVYGLLLPPAARQFMGRLFGALEHAKPLLGEAVLLLVLQFIGWILIFQLEIYDKLWDRRIARWRHYYAIDFILPRLLQPFASKLDPRFFEVAEANLRDFMRPFYAFVGDKKGDTGIGVNTLTRFYERVTKYWVTQIVEIIVVGLAALAFAMYFPYHSDGLALDRLLAWLFILVSLFLMNRWAAQIARQQTREATADEILEIHNRFSNELEAELRQLSGRYNLRFGP